MFKRNFFISMMSGEDGISSKRFIMIFFVALFAFNVVYNLLTGKAPAPIYQEQVFELVVICLGTVFGEGILKMIADFKNTKKTTSTTIVSPPDSTVTTITDTKEPKKGV
jgi:xanthosine utilization system XapX-like protein